MEEAAVTESAEKTAVDYEVMEAEYSACQQQLQSKEQALRILQGQLKKADLTTQRLKQEMKQLRSQLSRSQQITSPVSPTTGAARVIESNGGGMSFSINEDLIKEKEQLIQELEQAHWQIGDLERQVEQLNDEKENLVDEKLHYMTKYERILKCFEEEKKRQPPSMSTVQRVLDENKELQLALVEAKAGKDHFKSRVEKIKDAMQRKKSIESAGEQATSPDRKLEFKTARRLAELESLAKHLTESVKVKSVTISHQKRANKMLATDLARLQHKMNMWEASCTCGKINVRNLPHSHTPTPAHNTGKSANGKGAGLDKQPNGGVALDEGSAANGGVALDGDSAANGGVALDGGSVANGDMALNGEAANGDMALDGEAANGGVAPDMRTSTGIVTIDNGSTAHEGVALECTDNGGVALATESMSPERKFLTGSKSPVRKSFTGAESPDRKSYMEGVSPDRKSFTGSNSPDRKSLPRGGSPDKAELCDDTFPPRSEHQDIRAGKT